MPSDPVAIAKDLVLVPCQVMADPSPPSNQNVAVGNFAKITIKTGFRGD